MNILYVSKLTGNLFAGPNYSVPAQILAQSKIDNVFWYNSNEVKRVEWCADGFNYNNENDYKNPELDSFPVPFNNPDLVVIEGVYNHPFSKLIRDVRDKKIPYIIVPRSSLTKHAQSKRSWKKKIGNLLYFNSFIKEATAIHYLTNEEYEESMEQWPVKGVIIPNGINIPNQCKTEFSKDRIHATYIGRYEIYQKGLDMLLEAISLEQNRLRNAKFTIDFYGPDQEGSLKKMQKIIADNGIEDIALLHDAVFEDDKRSVLLDTDVFVMTSRFEGHPMGMIEALAYGIPCLATSGTNVAKDIKKYNAGWTAGNDVDSIVNALRHMVEEYGTIKEKSINAIELAKTFSWDEIAQKSHDIYINVVKQYNKI